MLRIVPHTVPRVGRSYEHFPDGFELHLLLPGLQAVSIDSGEVTRGEKKALRGTDRVLCITDFPELYVTEYTFVNEE